MKDLRQAASENIERSVPTASFAAGNLSYINSNPGCSGIFEAQYATGLYFDTHASSAGSS